MRSTMAEANRAIDALPKNELEYFVPIDLPSEAGYRV